MRTRYICSSCCAHAFQASACSIAGGGSGRARAAAINSSSVSTARGRSRGYATDAQNASASDAQTAKAADESAASGLASKAEKAARKTKGRNKNKGGVVNTNKPSVAKVESNKKSDSDAISNTDSNIATQAKVVDDTSDEANQLWKETLALMKELSASPAMRALDEKHIVLGKGKRGTQHKKSKNGDGEPASPVVAHRQAKMIQGAMGVLKSVLTIQAEKRAQAEKTKNTAKSTPSRPAGHDAGAEKVGAPSTAGLKKKSAGKETKDEDKKQVPKKKEEQEKQQNKKKSEAAPPSPSPPPPKKKKDQAPAKTEQTAEGTTGPLTVRSSKAKSEAKPIMDEKVSQGFASVLATVQAKKDEHPTIRESIKSKQAQKKALKEGTAPRPGRMAGVEKFEALSASALKPVDVKTPPVPLIQYGLDRVLFNQGVYVLQDPRTRVWNFDPYLANIMPVTQFDFDALKEYITSSKDTLLLEVTKSQGKKYTGSTSSMTSTMSHFHYLLSSWRPINPARLSRDFEPESSSFTNIMKAPAATILNYKNGAYAIDADKLWDRETVLTMLGKSMEMLLTAPKKEYEKYRRTNSHRLTEEEKKQDESYHYTTFGDFMMRSQLDAYDPRLPGTGVYDLKTRAVVSIRMDALNYKNGVGYQIRKQHGQWESFEREYYDMIRAAFLKYSLQVRMGRMDGIFVAYHNTQRIFGFQYIPLEEMDLSIHGDLDTTLGDREFTASLTLWNKLLDEATARFPEQSLRIHVETRPSNKVPFMYFFAEPVTDEEIKEIQEKKKEDVDKFREEVLGILPKTDPAADEQSADNEVAAEDESQTREDESQEKTEAEDVEEAEDSEQVWEEMMEVVEETMENDAQGITAIRDAIQEALEQSGLLQAKSPEEAQRYVEALLRSIVDVDAEQAKIQSEAEAENEGETDVETEARAEANASVPAADEPSAPNKSVLGMFKSWFGSSSATTETGAAKDSSSEGAPSNAPGKSEDAAETKQVDVIESSTSESVAADESITSAEDGGESDAQVDSTPSPDLVELIMKLTSRVGSSTVTVKTTQESSEDLEKLKEFEKTLIEMMPQPEASQEPAEKDTPTDTVAQSTSPTAEKQDKPEREILGMVLTVRNVVNGHYVDRPENLKFTDKWNVEYSIEKINDQEKARLIYRQLQMRRKGAHHRGSGKDSFRAAFNGMLTSKTRAGRTFRAQEDLLDRSHPAWVVGQAEPFEPGHVFEEGATLDLPTVKPSVSHKSWRAPVVPRNSGSPSVLQDTASFNAWLPPGDSIASGLQSLGYVDPSLPGSHAVGSSKQGSEVESTNEGAVRQAETQTSAKGESSQQRQQSESPEPEPTSFKDWREKASAPFKEASDEASGEPKNRK